MEFIGRQIRDICQMKLFHQKYIDAKTISKTRIGVTFEAWSWEWREIFAGKIK